MTKSERRVFKKFKKALMEMFIFLLMKQFDKGNFDEMIRAFVTADVEPTEEIKFKFSLNLLHNDILLVYFLLNEKPANKTIKRLKKLWGIR